MSLRNKFFIIVGVVVAFIIFVVVILSRGNREEIVVQQPSITNTVSAPSPESPPAQKSQPSAPVVSRSRVTPPPPDLLDLSRSFAERFGSFSNQSNFENVRELKPFMTATMRTWADQFIRDALAKADPAAPYYGITTRTLETKAESIEGDGAIVLAKTQRREVKGVAAPRVFFQDLSLRLKKVDGEWRVDAATWR